MGTTLVDDREVSGVQLESPPFASALEFGVRSDSTVEDAQALAANSRVAVFARGSVRRAQQNYFKAPSTQGAPAEWTTR